MPQDYSLAGWHSCHAVVELTDPDGKPYRHTIGFYAPRGASAAKILELATAKAEAQRLPYSEATMRVVSAKAD
jgi:hypothetical protein